MKFITKPDYETMSEAASEYLLSCLKRKPDALFCIATGYSPTKTYQLFVQKIKAQNLDTGRLRIIKLDEWYNLPMDSPSTCESYIRKNILEPLSISSDRYISFNSMEHDSEYECQRITELIEENHGIDCCVLGIGKNGHLGLNEPAASTNPFTHKAALTLRTREHSMLVSNHQTANEGYTLGIRDILNSRTVLLLATGDEKREAWAQFLTKRVSSESPVSYLWLHNHVNCFIDQSSLSPA